MHETGIQCERCESKNATRNAQMTNYNNEENNFATLLLCVVVVRKKVMSIGQVCGKIIVAVFN